jgi:peptide/nickel transport system substrate-binding protein
MLRPAPGAGRRPRWRLAAASAALAAGLWAVSAPALAAPSEGAAPAVKTTTFVVGNTEAVDTLNPYVGVTSTDYEAYGLIYDNLSDYSQNSPYGPAPRLAASMSVSKDQLTWTYHIRHGVRWSDGVPMTAADVVYTFWRDTQPNTYAAEYNSGANYVGNIIHNSIRAPDPYTAVMKVTKPTPGMAELIIPILPEHVWKHISEKQVTSFTNPNPVGTGLFRVTSFVPSQSLTMTANPHYWGGRAGISKVIFQLFNNPSAEAFALQNGTIDFAENLTYPLFNSLQGRPGITLNNAQSSNWDELAFNTGAATITGKPIGDGNPVLKDLNVRHAISYALDLPVLVRKVFLGDASPGTSVIPPMYPFFHFNPPPSSRYHYDPALAGRILAADGWQPGPGGIRVKNGKQLSLRLFIRSNSPTNIQDAPYVKAWLNAIGVRVNISFMSDTQLTANIGNGNYDMFIWGWGVEPNPNFQLSVFTCGQRSFGSKPPYTPGWSDSFYCDKHYDQLYQQQQTLSGVARQQVILAMEKQLYAADPYALLYYYNDDQAFRSDLFTGFAPQPDKHNGLLLFQATEWWSYRCMRPVGAPASLTSHNIGCNHTITPTKAQLRAAGITGPPLSGGAAGAIAGLLVLAALITWLLVRRHDAATADERE